MLRGEPTQTSSISFNELQRWKVEVTHIEQKKSGDLYFYWGRGFSQTGLKEVSLGGNFKHPVSVEPPFVVFVDAVLRTPQKSMWPGGYSEESYYQRKGWVGRLDIYEDYTLQMIPRSNAEQLRMQLMDRLKRTRGGGFSKRLARALVFGEGKALTKKDRIPFQNSGTAHVLAVSGLHVGMIYLLVLLCSNWIPKIQYRLWIHFVLSTTVLFAYSWFTGGSPSVIRASLMFIAWALADALQRSRFSLNGLWFAALVSLCYQPLWLFSPGFHLSYAAVASILIGFKNWPIPAHWSKWKRRISSMALVTLFAQMGTLGLSLHYFGIFPTYFFPANLIFTPLTPILLYGAWMLILIPHPIVTSLWSFLSEGYQWGLIQINRFPYAVFEVSLNEIALGLIALFLWSMLARARASTILYPLLVLIITVRVGHWHDRKTENRSVLYTVNERSLSAVIKVNGSYYSLKQDTSGYANFLEEKFLAEKAATLWYYPTNLSTVTLEEKIGPLGLEEKKHAQWYRHTGWRVHGELLGVRPKVQAYPLP